MRYLYFALFFASITACGKISLHDKALLKAAKQNNQAAVQKEIKNNANLNTQNKKGQTPLHRAKKPEVVHELIINNASLNAKTFDGDRRTPLYDALVTGNREKAITLILSGAEVNTRHHKGETPLNWAIRNDDYELVFYLIRAGATVRPRHVALARSKNYQSVATLLREFQKAKAMRYALNKLDKFGLSPMHYAILENNPIKLDALVLAQGQINLQNSLGQTPLHIAVQKNLPVMVEKLLQLFAKIDVEDNNGRTPIDLARQLNLTTITRMLLAHGANIIF